MQSTTAQVVKYWTTVQKEKVGVQVRAESELRENPGPNGHWNVGNGVTNDVKLLMKVSLPETVLSAGNF